LAIPRSWSARFAVTVFGRSTAIFTGTRTFSQRSESTAELAATSSNVYVSRSATSVVG
jgi:hypothetical protein